MINPKRTYIYIEYIYYISSVRWNIFSSSITVNNPQPSNYPCIPVPAEDVDEIKRELEAVKGMFINIQTELTICQTELSTCKKDLALCKEVGT